MKKLTKEELWDIFCREDIDKKFNNEEKIRFKTELVRLI